MINPIIKSEVNIILLFFANQFGRKMSKLSFSESEYLLATRVSGQNILNVTRVSPSPITNATHIQVYVVTLLVMPEYRT
jgi:hypothetical protein